VLFVRNSGTSGEAERAGYTGTRALQHVGVDHGGLHARMAHEVLDGATNAPVWGAFMDSPPANPEGARSGAPPPQMS